jgi:hypothetical protein
MAIDVNSSSDVDTVTSVMLNAAAGADGQQKNKM